jgi:hypothetical protein
MLAVRREPLQAGPDYWYAIERCLTDFHGWDPARAHQRVDRFKAYLAPFRSEDEDDLILHENPFYIANNMAGRDLDASLYHERYTTLFDTIKREFAEAMAGGADANAHLVGRAASE